MVVSYERYFKIWQFMKIPCWKQYCKMEKCSSLSLVLMMSLENHKLGNAWSFVLLLLAHFLFKVKYNIREQNKRWNTEENNKHI